MRYYFQVGTFARISEIEAHVVPPAHNQSNRLLLGFQQQVTYQDHLNITPEHTLLKKTYYIKQRPHGPTIHHIIAEDMQVWVQTRSKARRPINNKTTRRSSKPNWRNLGGVVVVVVILRKKLHIVASTLGVDEDSCCRRS